MCVQFMMYTIYLFMFIDTLTFETVLFLITEKGSFNRTRGKVDWRYM